MYKLMIVDDEKRIINGLKVIIDWEKINCSIVGEAINGANGVDLALQLLPDIIITDIKMPIMDGLQMIDSLKKKGHTAKFIILSGYSNFDYAKKGIDLGIMSYILKPIEQNDLIESVKKAIQEIEMEKSNEREKEILKYKVHENTSIIQDYILQNIVDSFSINSGELRELLDSVDLKMDYSYICSAILEIESAKDKEQAGITQEILDFVRKFIYKNNMGLAFKYSSTKIVIIIGSIKIIETDYFDFTIKTIQSELLNQIGQQITIGVGNIYNEVIKLPKSFEEARQSLSYKIVRGRCSIIYYKDIENLTPRYINISEKLITDLESCVDRYMVSESRNIIEQIFDTILKAEDITPFTLQLQCLNIIFIILKKTSNLSAALTDFFGKDILSLENISKFQTSEELKNWLINSVSAIIHILESKRKSNQIDIIDKIKGYIDNNYSKNITLLTVSKFFYFSPYYICQIFKKKTGQTFLNYVTQKRIQKAIELLTSSDMMIYEIAEKVGYNNSKYFSRIFEKLTGYKPSDYRSKSPNPSFVFPVPKTP